MKIPEGYLLRQIMDEWLVVPIDANVSKTGQMLSLNESSALLWQALEQGSDVAALTSLLCETYLVEEDAARKDVEKFLRMLVESGIPVEA